MAADELSLHVFGFRASGTSIVRIPKRMTYFCRIVADDKWERYKTRDRGD